MSGRRQARESRIQRASERALATKREQARGWGKRKGNRERYAVRRKKRDQGSRTKYREYRSK
eukprot:2565586-Pleurochrysis_carterae.AAC.4